MSKNIGIVTNIDTLVYYCKKDELEKFQMVIEYVRKANKLNYDIIASLLHIAVKNNSHRVIKYMIEELKCDVDSIDHRGRTPLYNAVRKYGVHQNETIIILLQYGADKNFVYKGNTLISKASDMYVQRLLENYCNEVIKEPDCK